MAPKLIKQKIPSNVGAPYARRFFNCFWTYRLSQLTTSNMRAMKDSPISVSLEGDSKKDDTAPVKSDLQPHALHTFMGDESPSIVLAIPKSSEHFRNLTDCSKGSLMAGHTDPQMFHWFKQLGTLPPRSIASGPMEIISGDLKDEVWEKTFSRHPIIHNLAQEMWEKDESKTEEEKKYIAKRTQEEDEKRMKRMSSSDWRSKHLERERNPTKEEDEEKPIYVIKPETFAVVRVRPDVKLWTNFCGQTNRVYEPTIPPMDPLARASPRFIRMLNLGRAKLISSLNINYNLKLTNAFIFEMDAEGMWAMGTQENFSGKNGEVREEWSELRLEFGKNQRIETEHEMEWWIRGLTRLGDPEVAQNDSSIDDAKSNPDDYDFRHS